LAALVFALCYLERRGTGTIPPPRSPLGLSIRGAERGASILGAERGASILDLGASILGGGAARSIRGCGTIPPVERGGSAGLTGLGGAAIGALLGASSILRVLGTGTIPPDGLGSTTLGAVLVLPGRGTAPAEGIGTGPPVDPGSVPPGRPTPRGIGTIPPTAGGRRSGGRGARQCCGGPTTTGYEFHLEYPPGTHAQPMVLKYLQLPYRYGVQPHGYPETHVQPAPG